MLLVLLACLSPIGALSRPTPSAVFHEGVLTPERPLALSLEIDGQSTRAAHVRLPFEGDTPEPVDLLALSADGEDLWSGVLRFEVLADAVVLEAPAGETQTVALELVVESWGTNMAPTQGFEIEVGCDEMAHTLTEDACLE